MPRIAWSDIKDSKANNVKHLADIGSVANFSIRVPKPVRSIEKGYASLSAGNRANAIESNISTFYTPVENIDGVNASDIYENQQGKSAYGSAGVAINFERSRTQNLGVLAPTQIGSLGYALEKANRSIAVFGNADICLKDVSYCKKRPVAYFGSDRTGKLLNGDISTDLLKNDLTMNMAVLEDKASQSLKEHDVTVVECSDLERLSSKRRLIEPDLYESKFLNAINQCDQLIGKLLNKVELQKDQVFVLSPMSSSSREELNLFVAAGKDISPGYATSGLSRRNSIVALGDIAPSILKFFSIEPPESMASTLLAYDKSSDSYKEKEHHLINVNKKALLRDETFEKFAVTFILTVFLTVVFSVFVFIKLFKLRSYAKYLCLLCAVMPLATFFVSPFMLLIGNPTLIWAAFLLISIMLSLILYLLLKKYRPVNIIFGISTAYVSLMILDILSGANMQLNSLLGYSAIVAGRFAGIGNMSFSILAVASIIFVASARKIFSNVNQIKLNVLLIFFLLLVLFVDGAPNFGSDVGGVLAIVPTSCFIGFKIFNKKINLKYVTIALVITLTTITAFSLFDFKRPLSERSHLGRFVSVLIQGNAGVVIERKIYANFHILTNSVFASVIVLTTIFLLVLFLRPEQFVKKMSNSDDTFSLIVYASLIAGVLGMFLNDSGVAIPGMMISIAVPALCLLAFEEKERNLNIFQSSKTPS
ncbi:MAG: hypothetical protein U0R17_04880 [Acidimicrobiia bacterium]